MEDWAEIRRLHRAERLPIKQIARVVGVSRNTVRAALRSAGPPKYERAARGSVVEEVEPRIRELLRAYPTMPATVIAERIGWTRSMTVLKLRVAQLRPGYLPPDPASRTQYVAGEIAQFDLWFPPISLPVGFGQTRAGGQLPVLTMVCGYSRWAAAVLIPTRTAEDLTAGWWQLLSALGAVPRVLVWDGESAVGRWRGGRSELTEQTQAFRGVLGAKVLICRPRDPEAKGLVERLHDYLERSFLPGRSFTGPADFNAQISSWLATVNTRPRRALGCAATDRIAADLTGMLTLPPVPPATGWRTSTRLARDHYVRLDSNDYSVHPAVIGRRVEVLATLERVTVLGDGRTVADHARVWAKHQTLSLPEHVAAARALRAERVGLLRATPAASEVEARALTDYDRALGLTDMAGEHADEHAELQAEDGVA